MNSMFLLGAGASIDGGLADAFSLTTNIYDQLRSSHDKDASKIFGLVVAKVLARKVRQGGSPFERVNVEEVYDGLRKLASRDTDFLADFATGWDPTINSLRTPIREREVEDAFQSLVNSLQQDNWAGRGRLKIGMGGARKVLELFQSLTNPSPDDLSSVERSLLIALVKSLQHDEGRIGYFEEIIDIIKENSGDIASLNYDLIAESAATKREFTYDYGLERWNAQKVVAFRRSSPKNIRILKLHGSLNWFAKGDDIEVRSPKNERWDLPNLVFGGASDKLRVDGPFLQLRHEFQTRLLNCNVLVIIGYSFQDEHLNSIIRRWTNTRRKAKLIVVNPAVTGSFAGYIGQPYIDKTDKKWKLTVDLNHIQLGAAAATEPLRELLKKPVQLTRKDRNGFLPHIHFNVVE